MEVFATVCATVGPRRMAMIAEIWALPVRDSIQEPVKEFVARHNR